LPANPGDNAVSERVGYGDLSTFRRLFKRETGLSPRGYPRRFSRRLVARQRHVLDG
jgi:AraC-like DNA-binding protein